MGKEWSGETKRKRSEYNKRMGIMPPSRKGKKCSLETRLKMSKYHTGRPLSLQAKNKLSEKRRGSNSNLWQGGISSLQSLVRSSFKYRQWRADIFTRDDYTCMNCNKRGGRLQADHIQPLSFIIKKNNIKTFVEANTCEELWNLNNGRTLCEDCHKKTETYMRGANKWKKLL